MAVIPTSGSYYRMRCATCGKYMVTRRRHARTCSALCRQQRKRGRDKSRPEFVEDLGFMHAGATVSGKLSEKIARSAGCKPGADGRGTKKAHRKRGSAASE